MPNPTSGDRISQVLTSISIAYRQQQGDYIASRVFPVIPVTKQTDYYYVWPKDDWFRDEMQPRGDAQESAGSGMRLSSDSYYARVWALHKDIGAQARANLENEVGLSRATTQWLTGRGLIRQEKEWMARYFTTSVWGTDSTPANLWSDPTLSTPISDIETARRTIKVTTGFTPNRLVLGYDVWSALKQHPDIVGRYNPTSSAPITLAMLAALLEIDEVLVASAVENTANEGLPAVMSFMAGKHALLAYAAPQPSLESPSAGYTFHWTGDNNNISMGLGEIVGVKQFRIEPLNADRYEIETAFDMKVTGTDLGYFFNSVVA